MRIDPKLLVDLDPMVVVDVTSNFDDAGNIAADRIGLPRTSWNALALAIAWAIDESPNLAGVESELDTMMRDLERAKQAVRNFRRDH